MSVLRITGLTLSISDPGTEFFHPGPRIHIKEFKKFNPKKWFLSSRKYDPGCLSRIPDPYFLPILNPGPRGEKGTGSRIRIRNTVICAKPARCVRPSAGTRVDSSPFNMAAVPVTQKSSQMYFLTYRYRLGVSCRHD